MVENFNFSKDTFSLKLTSFLGTTLNLTTATL